METVGQVCDRPCSLSTNLPPSALRQARAQAVLAALALWHVFRLTPDNLKLLASQSGVTPKQAEAALVDLSAAKSVRLVAEGRRIIVSRLAAESEAT